MPETAPTLSLADDVNMPKIGLGTWPMDDAEAEQAVAQALQLGWRLIDTAENYGNETGVGRGLAASGVSRHEVFVTSKFNRQWHSRNGVRQALENCCRRLNLDYLDLFLIHWPNPDLDRYVDAWQGMIDLHKEGLVRAIGTSNFLPQHLQRLIDATGIAPAVNQIQLCPWWPQHELQAFHRRHGIITECWSPIGRGGELLDQPQVQSLAAEYERSPAQIVLRWHIEQGIIPIPKSSDPRRQAQNLEVFDFSLTAEDMESLTLLSGQGPAMMNPMTFGH